MISQSTRVLIPTPVAGQAPMSGERQLAGIAELWHATIHTLSTYSAPILACALIGLVGASLLGALANAILTFDAYVRTGGIFPTYSNTFYIQLLIQAGLGTFAIAMARGAITWISLNHAAGERVTLREALDRSFARLPLLLMSSLIYGALMTLGVAGLTLLLRQLRLDVTSIGRVNVEFDSIARVIGVRVVNGFVPEPGSPFSELVSYARYLLRRSSTNYYWLYAYRYSASDVPLRLWLIGLASFVPMIAGGTVLRLRSAAIMGAPQPNHLSSLYDGMQVSARHFSYVLKHGTVIWVFSSLLSIVFVTIPLALSQYLLVPTLAKAINNLWPYPASTLLFAIGTALISMVLIAFTTVYDAHLYAGIHQTNRPNGSAANGD